jgi:alkanesulfonate monooxygenase SsuD/methylene tetrahydromethanopterin reductase-like flavin-dependent oxidoreductase (luciferase family)
MPDERPSAGALSSRRHLHLGVALDDAGAHPAAWRAPGGADGLLSAARLEALARTAEQGLFDFVSLDDSFDPVGLAPDDAGRLPARFDALLALTRVAPVTERIGLLPTVTTTHTEPFHVSKNVATLDLVSGGRGGWRLAVSRSVEAAGRFGRKAAAPVADLYGEADDVVEVVRRLWDSWEDGAVIRDVATGRYVDRDRLHYVDFEGRFFRVRGPSITPRPPQGQPLVAMGVDEPEAAAVAARRADVVFVDAANLATARARRAALRAAVAAAGRDPDEVAVLVVARVGERALRDRLDPLGEGRTAGDQPVPARSGGPAGGAPDGSEFLDLVGDAAAVAGTLASWFAEGAADGFLLRPDALPATLDWLVAEVVPRLQTAGVFRTGYEERTLRERFGLPRPPNRYAAASLPPSEVPS